MGWRRQVTCSYCYESGHTKRSCKKLKADAKKALEYKATDPDYYVGWKEREAIEQIRANKERKQRPRLCKYCAAHFGIDTKKDKNWGYRYELDDPGVEESSGHNIRTCKRLKADVKAVISETLKRRKDLVAWAKENNFAPGAMVRGRSGFGDDEENYTLYLVTDVDLSQTVYDPKEGHNHYTPELEAGGFEGIRWTGIVVGNGENVIGWHRAPVGEQMNSGAFMDGMPHLYNESSWSVVEPAPEDEEVDEPADLYRTSEWLKVKAKRICEDRV